MDLTRLNEAEICAMSKAELRELVIAQAEELRRLQARLRAQEDQIKQLSLHSLIQSGLEIIDDDGVKAVNKNNDRDDSNNSENGSGEEEGAKPRKGGSHLMVRSPHTPPPSPVAESPLDHYEYVLLYPLLNFVI